MQTRKYKTIIILQGPYRKTDNRTEIQHVKGYTLRWDPTTGQVRSTVCI